MSVTEVSSVSTIFPSESYNTREDKVTSFEPMSVTKGKVTTVEHMSVAQVSSVFTTLPTQSQLTKQHKVFVVKPISESEVSLGSTLVKLSQIVILESLYNHQRPFDFLSCKYMYDLICMWNFHTYILLN